ncbi:unnamed protein product [Periconia digitata]|uniref:Small ribosomal subunit protein bS6m n=1 Tax=Periconia digitata TaxID=1303443 RepID=A0A9W4UUZ9_9PLEO|nr:unnamed protein product [Periconia digitata]
MFGKISVVHARPPNLFPFRRTLRTSKHHPHRVKMLYEMIGVVRPGRLSEVKEIARTAGKIVLDNNGVVRGVSNWGTFLLPKPALKLQTTHHAGHHFIMRFDASANSQHLLRRTMSLDPRLIRYSIVKIGTKFEDIKDVEGVADFKSS